jgi:AraC-like DNA-binding protein
MSRKRRTAAAEPFFVIRTSSFDVRSGYVIEEHDHDWHQLIHASAGVMTVWTEAGSWVAPPSGGVWVPSRVRHGIRFVGESAFRTIYLRPNWFSDLPTRCTAVMISPLLRQLVIKTGTIGMLDRRDPTELAMATLIVHEFKTAGMPPFSLPQPVSVETRRAAAEIAGGAASIASAARTVGMGVRTLERRFHAETGMTLGRWRRHQSLLAALERLAIGDPIKAVAAQSGYATPSAFVAAFRSCFGTTPGRYFVQAGETTKEDRD